MGEKRDLYVEKMKTKLDKWSAEIDKLEAQARKLGSDSRGDIDSQIQALKDRRVELKTKIDGVRKAADDVWRDLKEGVEGSGKALIRGVRSAFDRLKERDATQQS